MAIHLSAPGVIERPDLDDGTRSARESWIVTVFDNEKNTWDEVMSILMIATQCGAEEAYMETWEIDHLGRSVVHQAGKDECASAAAIIAQIGIRVEVSSE